ncbi:ion channel regulatory protein UNC-93 domain-containing protein [Hirsutella rhossiliensis]|uniref:Ion channel regulatory protein UNC-93 domain-containing protein n=1 Tax=Hirsutella rhossiliensis TaxID=111463 RepID=A0A9P8MNB1_9HYPO|nr:ion channel regulatory protein UNC-93 domain-containing protein [Hirsutella rhossiliensis]KAH0958285.1 ion channel regulatory protein UNC-93 domain-containing protein [Hirsutella rhossiliensis]
MTPLQGRDGQLSSSSLLAGLKASSSPLAGNTPGNEARRPSDKGSAAIEASMIEMGGHGAHQRDQARGDSFVGLHASGQLVSLYSNPWTQILLISFICFCLPGMYNALTGLGGSGQVDSTVAANATVAMLSTTAATALFIVGPVFAWAGPRLCFMAGAWAYPLYSGSLLEFNRSDNGAFVIASGAILGVGASLLWIVQGAIMTTYVDESQKGRAIAVFWVIFNLGGGIGSLASFGLNYRSTAGSVTSSTYVALMAIMIFGWLLGLFICSPSRVQVARRRPGPNVEMVEGRRGPSAGADSTSSRPLADAVRDSFKTAVATVCTWRVACMLPLFFSANVFYSYQQNNVNGDTFNIRTRSLNGALYWMAQMFGGLLMGLLLDLPCLDRPARARLGWAVVFVTGMVIWGGGYEFQKWQDERLARGLRQDVDFKQSAISTGPIFLYIFYGAYDALWQSYAYWLIGTESNSPARAAVLVGAYKSLQAAGGAMAWRINAIKASPTKQLAMDWGLCIGSLIVVLPMVWTVSKSTPAGAEETEKGGGPEPQEADMGALQSTRGKPDVQGNTNE